MPEKSISYPKVSKRYDGLYYIDFKLNNKRIRMFSGKKIGSSTNPNTFPLKFRRNETINFAKEVYDYLVSNNYSFVKKPSTKLEFFDSLIERKLSENLSVSYLKALIAIARCLREQLVSKGHICPEYVDSLSLRHHNNTSYNTTRRHVNVLVNYLYENDFDIKLSKLKSRRQTETLHKPIENVKELLNKIKMFSEDLYLCCVLTYCCLLRPHQEIRLLKWSDFSEDLSHISLSGNKVKSKRNRVVPVPKLGLVKTHNHLNIFTGRTQPYNRSYFSTLWKRFKKVNPSVEQGVTIYSFRHSGAIEIFKRTGSLTKLQKAMGHSSLNVSLTYLRGLEVAELKEEDMPMV
ncbi:MAG: tyrosine-type recombinase/integrase [Flavobacteriaceae bacterium]|nr:tyrosine-type recombinase/integrase [Flavobacteriaceae bacterium]